MTTLDPSVPPACPPAPAPRSLADIARAELSWRSCPPEADGCPCYDDDDDPAVPPSPAHTLTVQELAPLLHGIAPAAGLQVLGDPGVLFWIPVEDDMRMMYPDHALTAPADPLRTVATDLRLALEVVSDERTRQALKNNLRIRAFGAGIGVPEFALLYPEPDDARALRRHQVAAGGDRRGGRMSGRCRGAPGAPKGETLIL